MVEEWWESQEYQKMSWGSIATVYQGSEQSLKAENEEKTKGAVVRWQRSG